MKPGNRVESLEGGHFDGGKVSEKEEGWAHYSEGTE